MSVIQDALKRKLVEQQEGKVARAARPAGPSAPPPPPSLAQQVLRNEEATRAAAAAIAAPVRGAVSRPPGGGVGRWILGSALVLLFAVLVVGVLLYLSRGVPLVAVPPPASTVQPSLPPATVPVQAAASPPAPVSVGSAPSRVPVAAPAGALPSGALPRSAWPEIMVDGVMAGAEANKRSAIMNGQMIFLNQRIDGVRLVEVNQSGVRLQYQGKEIELEIGQATNDSEY